MVETDQAAVAGWCRQAPTTGRNRARLAAVAGALVLVVLAAACGGGGGGEAKKLTVTGTEMSFDAPQKVASGDYDITFRNEGTVYHELALTDASGQFVTRQGAGPGKSVVMEAELTPGTWELSCHEIGHYEAGMHRPLEVTDG